MEATYEAPLTPEQLAAVNAGGGYARCEDPVTHVVYHVIREGGSTAIDDDYIREKLAEAQADIDHGRYAEWNLEEMKRELRQRIANAPSGR